MKIDDLVAEYSDKTFNENFAKLFGLKYFLNNCIISKEYDFDKINTDDLVLSIEGLELLEILKSGKYSTVNESTLKLAVFLEFYNTELLIDVNQSDCKALSKSISDEIINGNLLFPWIYGRVLYDKYFEEFEEQANYLDNESTLKLLKDTPKGVFQMGSQIIGPLGILETKNKRILPPTKRVKLWHCSDPSCNALHNVNLQTARTSISDILSEISDITFGKEISEWYTYFTRQCETENSYYDDYKIEDIPLTLVYSFGGKELKLVLKELIDFKQGSRDILPVDRKFQGSSEKIVNSLTKAECFQTILLFSSLDILVFTEKLISERKIHIPSTEIRSSRLQKTGGYFKIYHECNKLGFRAVSGSSHLSFIHLRNLILNLHDEPNLKQQLEWKLKFYDYESLKEKVEAYINSVEPHQIIKDTVLSGVYQVSKTFEYLPGYYQMPKTLEEENLIVNKILWKLGFNINIYPTTISLFEDRLSKFRMILDESNIYGETEKEKIRSSAVNLFVSLEEILKNSLAFSTWLLLSDHFRTTYFCYNYSEATAFMTHTLNGYKLNADTELLFDASGKNTLYPLIEGFTALFGICDRYFSEGNEKFKRSEDELPRFFGKTNLVDFPLIHKMLLFDIKINSYLKIREIGLKIPSEFNRNKVLAVRNALEHDREEFPPKNDLINACDCLSFMINEIINAGLYPNVYLFHSLSKDKYNRILKTFEDYSGKKVSINELINYKGYPIPSTNYPNIIVPNINFPGTMEALRIKYEENSEYLYYWKNFPRRKLKIKEEETPNDK